MRKIDYAHLAQILREEITRADKQLRNPGTDQMTKFAAVQVKTSVFHIGTEFANVASVDKTAFLNACGIDSQKAN